MPHQRFRAMETSVCFRRVSPRGFSAGDPCARGAAVCGAHVELAWLVLPSAGCDRASALPTTVHAHRLDRTMGLSLATVSRAPGTCFREVGSRSGARGPPAPRSGRGALPLTAPVVWL